MALGWLRRVKAVQSGSRQVKAAQDGSRPPLCSPTRVMAAPWWVRRFKAPLCGPRRVMAAPWRVRKFKVA